MIYVLIPVTELKIGHWNRSTSSEKDKVKKYHLSGEVRLLGKMDAEVVFLPVNEASAEATSVYDDFVWLQPGEMKEVMQLCKEVE